MIGPVSPPILRGDSDQSIFERSAGRRLRLPRRPPASPRSRFAVQSALDRAASAGHSYARSSGSPLESEAPQLPRSEPDGQPTESSQLARAQRPRVRALRPLSCRIQAYPLGGGTMAERTDVEFRVMPSGDGRWYWEVIVGRTVVKRGVADNEPS